MATRQERLEALVKAGWTVEQAGAFISGSPIPTAGQVGQPGIIYKGEYATRAERIPATRRPALTTIPPVLTPPVTYEPERPGDEGQVQELGISSLLTLAVAGAFSIYTWLAGLSNGNGGELIDGGVDMTNGNGNGLSPGDEPYEDVGGLGREGREGAVGPGRTTLGTGVIAAETFRAWDPIQQRYYQLRGSQAYQGLSLEPGKAALSGDIITKSWVTHAWRKDGSLASTQMAMTAGGRMVSLSEDGRMKSWRPYKSIVIGKTLTTSSLRRVAHRVKSHTKSLKKILSVLK